MDTPAYEFLRRVARRLGRLMWVIKLMLPLMKHLLWWPAGMITLGRLLVMIKKLLRGLLRRHAYLLCGALRGLSPLGVFGRLCFLIAVDLSSRVCSPCRTVS